MKAKLSEQMTDGSYYGPRELSEVLLDGAPEEWHPSDAAKRLLRSLSADIDREGWGAIEHAAATLNNLRLFCKDLDEQRQKQMADAALLHDVPGRILHQETDERATLSRRLETAWAEYISEVGGDNPVHNFMHDQVVIGMGARDYRERIKQQLGGGTEHVNDSSYDGELERCDWKTDIPAIRGKELEELVKHVNVESLIVKAAEMMDNIKRPPQSDSQQLRNILEAESFYIPMLKAMGYDAMAAEIDSSCNIYRLHGQGRTDIVEKAAAMYHEYTKQDPARLAMTMFGLSEPPEVNWIVNETSDDIYGGINCRFAEMIIPIDGVERRVLFRQKSIGSMAKKLAKNGGDYSLLDAFGFQVIVKSEDNSLDARRHYELSDEDIAAMHASQTRELGECFAAFAEEVITNPNITLQSTNGVRKPVFVQGEVAFVERIMAAVDEAYRADIGREIKSGDKIPYRVAKATAMAGALPVEVQMLTELDRKLGRTGETSHIAYKNGGNDALRWIQALHRRVDHMKAGDGNPVSREVGRIAVQAVLRQLYAGIFAPDSLHDNRVQ
ncbi:MAG: hypothetical protein Q4A37_01300 [Candidatus Saccharibacteria bacterium]|nr:hypothetical protein [Candidatus Saccharibacteria bacterium]